MIRIEERDREIIKCCYEQHFITIDHINDFFYKNSNKRRAYERVQTLIKNGYFYKERSGYLNKSILRLTKKGVSYSKVEFTPLFQKRRIDSRHIIHDSLVTSIRLRLKDFWDFTWIPERAIKDGQYIQVPDGLVVFKSKKIIAIECENSIKSKRMYFDNFKKWKKSDILMVLFVTTKPTITKSIKNSILQSGISDMPLCVVEWVVLKKEVPSVWSTRGELGVFNRREF